VGATSSISARLTDEHDRPAKSADSERDRVSEPYGHELTADWTYIRFHSGSRGRRGNYSESELEEWAQRIERWRRDHDVYAYFNNDREGFAVRNALRLKERLGV
jgi:uncharacterized protein YecE (DUF72 family)